MRGVEDLPINKSFFFSNFNLKENFVSECLKMRAWVLGKIKNLNLNRSDRAEKKNKGRPPEVKHSD
jgi:hypothetical protein